MLSTVNSPGWAATRLKREVEDRATTCFPLNAYLAIREYQNRLYDTKEPKKHTQLAKVQSLLVGS